MQMTTRSPVKLKACKTLPVSAKPTRTETPLTQQAEPLNVPLVCKTLNTKNLSSTAKEIILVWWRPGTCTQYHSYLGRWEKFCAQKAIIVQEASVENRIDFLASLNEDGLGYNAINTVRSASSSVLAFPGNVTFSNHIPACISISKRSFWTETIPTYILPHLGC